MKKRKKLVFVLGIRPDIIRSSLIIKHLEQARDIEFILVWSGQHYDNNLKGVFFDEFQLRKPDIELNCKGKTDAEISSKTIAKLYPILDQIKPDAVSFLGDTNTTAGCLAAAQLNIPIIHIEGCWHSYDWRMPEEKYRTMIDHLSDVVYTYAQEYKVRGIAEGLNPENIVVTGNPILDLLDMFYYKRKKILEEKATEEFFKERGLEDGKYYLMTCHRRENVEIISSFKNIMKLISYTETPIFFPASYRTQKIIKKHRIQFPKNLIIVDPIGYEEMLILLTHSKAVITDSGVMPEEASILNIPCINMRKSVERPEIYDAGGAVKFDPEQYNKYPPSLIYKKLEKIIGKKWQHKFGEKGASEKIAKDIIKRLRTDTIRGHLPENNHLPIQRSFIEDGIKI